MIRRPGSLATVWRLAVALAALACLPAAAPAQNRYAVLHIRNSTRDITIHYRVRWGGEAWGAEVALKPGGAYNHWYPFDAPDQNAAPTPRIRFSTGINRTRTWQVYDLTAYASPTNTANGKRYHFEKRTDSGGEDYIELFSTNEDRPYTRLPSVLPAGPTPAERLRGANDLVAKRDFRAAATALEEIVTLRLTTAQRVEAQNLLAVAAIRLGRYRESVLASRLALVLDPGNAIAYSNRGAAYFKLGNYPAAIQDCNTAIAINPKTAAPYRWRSQVYAKLGQSQTAVADYEKALALNPQEKERFEFTPVMVDRGRALQALAAFPLGSTLTPSLLREINSLTGGEPIDGGMSADPKVLLANERRHRDAMELEMVVAADRLLNAALLSPAERAAQGLRLDWLFGPVSAPNSRTGSKDGLAGLRLIARLELPEGKVINAITGVRFYPPANPASDEEGTVGLLSDLDNLRLEVRLFAEGTTKTDYAFQSFSVAGRGAALTMRPGFYLDAQTGKLVRRDLDAAGLGTSCINCHLSGPRVVKDGSHNRVLMAKGDYRAMEGFKDFLDQMRHWNAGLDLRRRFEERMAARGPAALLPLAAMLEANRAHWVSLYPRHATRLALLVKGAG